MPTTPTSPSESTAADPPPQQPQQSDSRQESRPPWRVEGARPKDETEVGKPAHKRPSVWAVLGVLLVLDWFLVLTLPAGAPQRISVPYSYFTSQLSASNIATVTAQGSTIEGTFRHSIKYPASNGTTTTRFKTNRPTFAKDDLLGNLLRERAVVSAKPVNNGQSPWVTIFGGVLPTLLLFGLFGYMFYRSSSMGGGAGGMFGLGRSKAHKYEATQQRTTFRDVAGIDEATDELAEVVDFLKHPERYQQLGGEIPHGVLLSGQPGTGKTLLARAVAGEADVPFFSISASEFVEMIVGVGASRVRDLFDEAKQAAPSIIFIDELDAIGRSRGGGQTSGANDEREQTLNQILTEMDGFTGNEGVIVLAATNRPEVLDSALLRPGRFDRRITVSAPDQAGRLKILQVHTRKVPLEDPSDLEAIAATTPGMVGADLKNLVNEAALAAARKGESKVSRQDFTNALERITLGAARQVVISEEERRRTAFHESGHALLGMLEPGADPVRKISIIPRGRALGVTFQSPQADRYGYGERYLRGRLVGMLGGRAAEIMIYGETTTGPESDLEQATSLARQMVGRWGMSDQIGPVSALPPSGEEGYTTSSASQRTLELVDKEVKRIIDECAEQAKRTLGEHREQLDRLTEALLARETLDEADAYAVAGIPAPSVSEQAEQPVVAAVSARETV
jgi:cell division protease FtsH